MKNMKYFIFFLFFFLGVYLVIKYENKALPKKVFFSLKTLSQKGQPVAGAKVYCNGQDCGVTDSFGYWRQLRKIVSNEIFTFVVQKKIKQKKIQGEKKILLPMNFSSSKTPHIRTSLKLK